MKKFAIITDSCSDLSAEYREKYNIDYVKMGIIRPNGHEMPASLDWDEYSPKELYDWMKNGETIKTNLVTVATFTERFSYYLKQDMDIIYIACSSALSGSIDVSKIAKDMLLEEYPEAKIFCIDSLAGSMTEGMVAYYAALEREKGKTVEEVVDWIEKNKLRCNQFATVETLDYLKKAGRVKGASAFFGNLFGVKPVFISDAKGQNFVIAKIKGRKKSMDFLVQAIKDTIIDPENQTVFVGHADDLEAAEYLKAKILEVVKCKDVYINWIGPIVGATSGPGTLGAFCFGKTVTVFGEE